MQKKHTFSPNHKVVTDSKHNFHPHGAPTTASMGAPPKSIGGGGGEQPGGDADGDNDGTQGGNTSGLNFCNGGMKYADGGNIFERAGEAVSRGADKLFNSASNQYDTAHTKPSMPLAAEDQSSPGAGVGGAQRTKNQMDEADKAS